MNDTGIQFHGAIELQRELEKLTGSLQRKYLRQGVAAAGRQVINATKARAPRRSAKDRKGDPDKRLASSIRQKPSSSWRNSAQMAREGVIGTAVIVAVPWAAAIEFGHHLIAWGHQTDKDIPAKPFFRPAVDASRGTVASTIESKAREGLEKEAARIASVVNQASKG